MVKHPDPAKSLILDAYTEAERDDFLFHIGYLCSVLTPNLVFEPFVEGPPFSIRPAEQIVHRGDLSKLGHVNKSWRARHFELTMHELRYYDGTNVKGFVELKDATLIEEEGIL